MGLLCSCATNNSRTALPVYLDETKPVEERVEDALSRMTLEEKVRILHAQSKFSSAGVPRLGIPDIWCTDGPHGIRPEVLWDEWEQAGWTNDSCTAYPALTCLAATWDRSLAESYGISIGEEAKYRRKNVLLGPGVNIYRSPLNGRNFEYMGEDPYLAGKMSAQYVRGVQSNGVAACVKHYALNNQESHRHTVDVHVDDRALYEIYLPAFKAAVQEGGAWSIMGSYNLYKNQHCCHNQYLLNDILKGEWGFDGAVISDWGGVEVTSEAISNGLDLEYGTWTDGLTEGKSNVYDTYHLALPYLERLRSGEADVKTLDEKVRRVLRLQMRTNLSANHSTGRFVCPEHSAVARRIGDDGIVLLKNDGILPLDTTGSKKILVVGENAIKKLTVGGGSSSLKAQYEILPLEGLQAALDGKAEVKYERGYVGEVLNSYNGVSTGQDLSDSRTPEQLVNDAVAAAADADYVIVFGGLNKSKHQDAESADRLDYSLPYGQDALVEALAEVNANLVFVNISGNAVAMPWLPKVKAVLQGWFLGSEAGNSIADVLTGRVNPSGKLPFTFPVALADGPISSESQYPGIKREGEKVYDEYYTEGIYVGYRWYESRNVPVLFPFGHGLSYTEFEYGEAKLSASALAEGRTLEVSVPVKNVGKMAGAEVVQLYVSDPECSVDRPVKELKGFGKLYLEPGETGVLKFTLGTDDLAYFDAGKHQWVAEPGVYRVLLGASSADIRAEAEFELR
ncbi:MAG: glycoside hydrolase family 3 C-terminal domain-containing protein [Candidatus Cryptobacteroides sp.]|nr:glycoside hydrolase family 3 C-terminal domain-containing protein [Candidatus Cryptobacteroides sp.]